MKLLDSILQSVDNFQQKHVWAGFSYGVIKKYGDDEAGYEAALITYYGFLSIFPLLLVATSTIQLIARNNQQVQEQFTKIVTTYFPILGTQLEQNIHGSTKTGAALFIGLLLTFYGARGGADAFQHAVNHIWHVPKTKRAGFPQSIFKSFGVVIVGGMGLGLSAYLAALTTGFGHLWYSKVIAAVISLIVLTITFSLLMRLAVSNKAIQKKSALLAACISALGIFVVQTFGSYLLTNQLKNLSILYGTFAVVLGLLFWIYLQVQVVMYAVEVSTVTQLGVWPRSLTQKSLTQADKKAYTLLAEQQLVHEEQKISVKYKFRLPRRK